MIAVDTNIIIRLLVNDDKKQAEQSKRLFSSREIFISNTVLLETEWVLRYAYNFERNQIGEAFKKLLGLENTYFHVAHDIEQALKLYEIGLDFADALHLSVTVQFDKFATFDKKLMQKAKKHTHFKFIDFT